MPVYALRKGRRNQHVGSCLLKTKALSNSVGTSRRSLTLEAPEEEDALENAYHNLGASFPGPRSPMGQVK
jgi:hypothetical protein